MKRTTIILAIVAVLGILFLGSRALSASKSSNSLVGYELATARRGEIVATVNATGAVTPRNRAALTFASPGRITEIKVAVGDRVEAGQVLATIDARDLEQAVAQAEAMLRMSQARLAQAQRGASAEEIAAAKANLESAQENLKRLQAGTSARDLEIARLRWEQAKDQLWSAQAQRDATCGNPNAPSALKDQTQAAVASASMAAEIARLQYEQAQEGASANDLKAAEAQVAQAQANYARLVNGPAAEEIRAAQAQVDQNAASLEQARLRLEGATLKAPFAGIVAGINGRVGEVASAATAVITLVDLSSYHVDVSIDETSIGQVQAGQPAEIYLDAFPDQTLTGQVTHVDPVGTLAQGLVNYRVTVEIGPTEIPLKADMTASVNIITARKADVVLIPNRAVRRDRDGRYVEAVVDGRPQRQSIEIGLANESETEVTSGLSEGMQVVVSAPRQSLLSANALEGR
jgi:HlyD family secretion protein